MPYKNKEYLKQWREANKEKIKKYNQDWRESNRDKAREQRKRYREKYPDRIREQKRLAKQNPKNRLDHAISRDITKHLRLNNVDKANRKWESLVGYNCQDLLENLESKFKDGMTWDNYGSHWHIDHIKPKSLYKYSSAEDPLFKECWALDNLQPLEAKENIRKGNRYIEKITTH